MFDVSVDISSPTNRASCCTCRCGQVCGKMTELRPCLESAADDRGGRWKGMEWREGAVAVVTGATRGLGQGMAQELARRGVTVVATARDWQRGRATVEKAVREEPALAGRMQFHQLDVTSDQSVADLANWLHLTYGGIDILINNAGVAKVRLEVYEEAVETVETNYFGTRRVTEKLLPLLRASPQGARIVMISSRTSRLEEFANNEYLQAKVQDAVDRGDKSVVDDLAAKYLEAVKGVRVMEEHWASESSYHYKESKLFLNTYTRILAQEVKGRPEGHRILVTAMCPGGMLTDMTKGMIASVDPLVVQLLSKYKFVPVAEAAVAPVWIALLPREDFPHGQFSISQQPSTF